MATPNYNQTYTPSPNPLAPGVAQSPFGLPALNAPGSNYATLATQGTTKLIRDEIFSRIFDAAPAQFNSLRLLFENTWVNMGSDELIYFEKLWGRRGVTVYTGYNNGTGVTPIAGTYAAREDIPLALTDVIATDLGQLLAVTAVTWSGSANASTITLAPMTGASLPTTLANGTRLSFAYTNSADGTDMRRHYDRANVVERYNYLQSGDRTSRWSTKEYLKWQNMGTTDYLDIDKAEKLTQLRVDMFSALWQGVLGEFTSTDGRKKTMQGIVPAMIAAGAGNLTSTAATVEQAFIRSAFASNYLLEGATRFIYGTDEMLTLLSTIFKNPVKYAPNDKIADMNLNKYQIGSMNFVPVPTELFRSSSYIFPESWEKKLIVVDQKSIHPARMNGLPEIQIFPPTNDMNSGAKEDYKEWTVRYNMSMTYNNPNGGFILNVI